MMKQSRKLIAFLLAALMLLGLCACGKKSEEKKYLGENPQAVKQYLDYAKQLEDAGNAEAAAQVYTMIEKAVTADTLYEGREKLQDKSEYRILKGMTEDIKQFNEWKKVLEK